MTGTADWCVTDGPVTICGTKYEEYSRDSMGVRWCFHHRRRHEFFWVVMSPAGRSYYGPHASVCGETSDCTDLFPGWSREAIE